MEGADDGVHGPAAMQVRSVQLKSLDLERRQRRRQREVAGQRQTASIAGAGERQVWVIVTLLGSQAGLDCDRLEPLREVPQLVLAPFHLEVHDPSSPAAAEAAPPVQGDLEGTLPDRVGA